MEKEFSKVSWLEELAERYEVPVEQVMIAWSTYQETTNISGFTWCMQEFESILFNVFN